MPEIVLWDSCIIIDAIQRKEGVYEYLAPTLTRAEAGSLFIVVSTVSIAEVTYCRDLAANGVSQEEQNRLIHLLMNNDYVVRRNADVGVCEAAADLARQVSGVGSVLTPIDSIVLATAIKSRAEALITKDDGVNSRNIGLLQLDRKFGEPNLRIQRPEDFEKQPDLPYGK